MKSIMGLHLLLLVLLINAVKTSPNFKENAADFVAASFKKTYRMGVAKVDFTKLEIQAKPLLMVEHFGSIDKNRVTIEIKSDAKQWRVIEAHPNIRGGVYTWTVPRVAPCKTHQIRLWVHGKDESQSSFQFPDTVQAAGVEAIASSGYQPQTPGDIQIDQTDEAVVLRWSPSPCADLYDVTYSKVTVGKTVSRQVLPSETPSLIISDGIGSCSEYEVKVAAVTGDEYSDDTVSTFSTSPQANAAERLEPIIIPTTDGVTAKWRAFEKLPCIEKYLVSVCREGNDCPESKEKVRDNSLLFLDFSSSIHLEQCSEYSLHIKPLFLGVDLYEKVINFRTLSPKIGNINSLITSLEAFDGDEQMITVKWNAVQCATQYLLYQKVNTPDGEWEMIGITRNNYFQQNGVPCTEYKYGVKVTVDDEESEIVEYSKAVMTKLDESGPYVAANLDIEQYHDGAKLSWDHGQCINSYRLKYCEKESGEKVCYDKQVFIDNGKQNKVTYTLDNLKACSEYTLQIYPFTDDGELDAELRQFRTENPIPRAPDSVEVGLNTMTNRVDLSWSKVECATGYKIHQKLEHSDTQTDWNSDNVMDLTVSLESPEPCVTYSYGVSSLIDSEESQPSDWFRIPVPPRFSEFIYPTFDIVDKLNNSITIKISGDDKNHRCKVAEYNIKYGKEDINIDADSLSDGRITIEKLAENMQIKGRIRYEGYTHWSQWISSDDPKQERQVGDQIDFLIPVIIGSILAVAGLTFITLLIVRKKKAQIKYDVEKVRENVEEIEKLRKDSNEQIEKHGMQ